MTNPQEIFTGRLHAFDVRIAQEIGLHAAIVFTHITYWLGINASKKNAEMIDGKYWMYETQQQIADSLGYLTLDEVKKAIIKLLEEGFLIKANYNKNPFDKTNWYTVFDQRIILNKKSITKEPCGSIDSAADSAIRHSRRSPTAPSIYVQKEEQEDKQQQAASPPAAVSFQKPKIYECLLKMKTIPKNAEDLTQSFDENRIKLAIAYAEHPKVTISKTLEALLRWHCSQEIPPEPPKEEEEIEQDNREFAECSRDSSKLRENCYFEILSDHIEIGMSGPYQPFCLSYLEKDFKNKLRESLEKYGL